MTSDHIQTHPPVTSFTLSPLDWGLALAFSYRWPILGFASMILGIELFCEYLVFTQPLNPRQHFLLWLIYCAGNAWLVAVIQMFFVELVRSQREPSYFSVAARALMFLPKVLLSYGLLMALLVVYFRLPPALILLVFFMWAPNFCVGELYVRESDTEESDDDENSDDETIVESLFPRPQEALTSTFRHRSVWELGFLRSVRFVALNKPVAFQIALLHWCAEVLPRGIVSLMSGRDGGYEAHALSLALVTLVDAFVLAAASVVFLLVLPRRALEEIEVVVEEATLKFHLGRTPPRIYGSTLLYVIAGGLAAACSWYLFEQAKLAAIPPESVRIEVREVRWQDATIALTLRVHDQERRFRWLEPENFRLVLQNADVTSLVPKDGAVPGVPSAARHEVTGERSAGETGESPAEPTETILKPRLTSVYNEAGEKLSQFEFKPYSEPLIINLYFDVPGEKRSALQYALNYEAPRMKLGRVLLKGEVLPPGGM